MSLHVSLSPSVALTDLACLAVVALSATSCGSRPAGAPGRIMTYREYATVRHEVPYVLELADGDSRLVYYGARHSFDPSDPMHADIEARLAAMRPAMAFNEGGDPPTEPDRETAIRTYGEAGLLRHLGAKYGVPVRNADLPIEDEIRVLSATYTKRELLLFYVVRQLGSYNNMLAPPGFESYFAGALTYWGRHLGLHEAGWDVVHAEFERVFGTSMVPERIDRDLTDPVRDEFLTQRISRDASIARDRHIVDVLVDAMRRHRTVFAVMGASHVVMQEPALRARIGSLR